MYRDGHGVHRDDAEAVKWYRRAADQGYAKAQNNLGGMYADGQGVGQNETRAYLWFSLAAEQGDADAIKNLDLVARNMTPAQIVEGQRMARSRHPVKNK